MTDTVEAIVAEMRATRGYRALADWADRLQSAHDAEVGALREAVMFQEGARSNAEVALAVAESRLREAVKTVRACKHLIEHKHRTDQHNPYTARECYPNVFAAIDRAMEEEDG